MPRHWSLPTPGSLESFESFQYCKAVAIRWERELSNMAHNPPALRFAAELLFNVNAPDFLSPDIEPRCLGTIVAQSHTGDACRIVQIVPTAL